MRTPHFPTVLVLLVCASGATAAPIEWTDASGGNGHFYELFFPESRFVFEANDAAEAKTFNGIPGHLVTITSAAENQFLVSSFAPQFSLLAGHGLVWIGASDSETEGAWKWVAGPEAGLQFSNGPTPVAGGFANWGTGEPRSPAGFEILNDVAALNLSETTVITGFSSVATGQWMALTGTPLPGYIVEYSTPAAVAVPEPGTLALTLSGIAGLLLFRRSRL